MIQRMAAALQSMLTRGKVVSSRVSDRTMLQITGLHGVVQQEVELLLPPGFSARPVAGADIALFQVMARGDHVVAFGGDSVGQAQADLQPGEFGLSDGTNRVIFRNGFLELAHETKVRVVTPRLECTGAVVANCDSGSVGLTTHTHIHGPSPDPNS
jgi:phage gp45-like